MEDGLDVASRRSRVVLLTGRALLVPLPFDQAGALQAGQAFRQDVARDALRGCEEVGVAALAIEEDVAHDEERPAVPEDVEGAGDRTGRAQPRTGRHAASVTRTCILQVTPIGSRE